MTEGAAPGASTALGGYEILYELKAGGMGEVLLARRRGPSGFERLAAVKTIRAELRGQEHLRRMFLDEAQLLARLSHPAIAQIYDFGEDEGTLFLAMEYVAGVPFRDLIGRRVLPPTVSARAMAEALRGLHAAHELTDLGGQPLGVVHRDVSPDNLMLTFEGQVKVLDFGIALMRGRQAPVTELGTIKGKPPYLSPEQIKNQPIDRRTDIFAAGVVLHEMLTSQRLFGGDSLLAIARAIEDDPIAPPSALAGPLPAGLDEAVMTALEREPARRWQTADGFARALDAAAAGGETLADFAGRVLFLERQAHREWLAEVLSSVGTRLNLPRGRPSGIMTAQAGAVGEEEPRLTAQRPQVPPPRRARAFLLIAAAAITALAAVLWAVRLTRGDRRAAPAAAPDAAVALAAAVEPEVPAPAPVVDGGPVRPADAAPARTAGSRRRPPARGKRAETPPPAAPPPAGSASAAPGLITITVKSGTPYANVSIDGVHIGETPIHKREIAAGDHEVVLREPGSDKVRWRTRVRVDAGSLAKVMAP
ncbi:MAG TPA: serine/threonine-protein kinase [Kofleriaceae bacterium]|nr:serine/threonine-protein kinase [Kofleriaceae bacterium]